MTIAPATNSGHEKLLVLSCFSSISTNKFYLSGNNSVRWLHNFACPRNVSGKTLTNVTKNMINILSKIQDFEDAKTLKLFEQLNSLKEQEFLTREQLLKILKWKSPRPLKHYETNTESEIQEITKLAFATENDTLKIHILTALKGVRFPAASAILMFYDQTKYPVIDIRVWRQLYYAKLVDTNARGQNFSLRECEIYFAVIRQLAADLNISARQVEKRLFDYDRENQIGNLYN